jgi:hypothetical protein
MPQESNRSSLKLYEQLQQECLQLSVQLPRSERASLGQEGGEVLFTTKLEAWEVVGWVMGHDFMHDLWHYTANIFAGHPD